MKIRILFFFSIIIIKMKPLNPKSRLVMRKKGKKSVFSIAFQYKRRILLWFMYAYKYAFAGSYFFQRFVRYEDEEKEKRFE